MPQDDIPKYDLYEELEVSSKASAETIDAAYRSMVKRFHPDVTAAINDQDRIKRINNAHDWLIDPELRALYDKKRPLPSRPTRPDQSEARPTEPRPAGEPAPPPGARRGRPAGDRHESGSSDRSSSGRAGEGRHRKNSAGTGSDSGPDTARDQPGPAAPQPEPSLLARLSAYLPSTPVARVALALGLILVVTVYLNLVLPIVAILLAPALLPPFGAMSFRGAWRTQSAGRLLLFEATLPGLSGVALIIAGPNNPQYVIVGVVCIGVALLLLTSAVLVLSKKRPGITFGVIAAIAGLAWSAILLYALPMVGGGDAGGLEVAAWLLVPVVVLGLLGSVLRSPIAVEMTPLESA